ncbi:hypothetical protein DYE48_20820 [Halobacillus trueperi]|uniref:Glycosyltransferase RgtA/B/C/D-like domain-containing protein n=1 Tax=Halobacillus trueperi TaxID=156205 RepID=A0A3E0IX93_9BACI|nr:hypothetical protein DYE48_20820 [Halobacillus trueperi]
MLSNTNKNLLLLYIVITWTLLSILSAVFVNINIFIFGLLLNLIASITLNKSLEKLLLFQKVFFVNLLIVTFVYCVSIYQFDSPYYKGGSDDLSYELDAHEVVDQTGFFNYEDIRGNVVPKYHNSVGYIYAVSLIVRSSQLIGEFHTLLPRILNGFFMGLISVLAYNISNKYLKLSNKHSMILAYIIGYFPILCYTAAYTFRDIMLVYIIMSTFYLWSQHKSYNFISKLSIIIITAIFIFISLELRAVVAYYLIIIPFLFIFKFNKLNIRSLSQILIVLLILYTLFYEKFIVFFNNTYNRYSEYLVTGADGLSNLIFNMSLLPFGIFFRAAYAFITPFPNLEYIESFWLSIGTIFQILFLPYLIIAYLNKRHFELKVIFVLIFISIITTTFTFRHIVMYLPFGLLLIGKVYFESKKNTKKLILVISYTVFTFTFTLYSIMKYL